MRKLETELLAKSPALFEQLRKEAIYDCTVNLYFIPTKLATQIEESLQSYYSELILHLSNSNREKII